MAKFEFTGVEKEWGGVTLKQIRRLSDGLVGGWLQYETNLSQGDDSAWVSNSAQVSGSARVSGSAQVSGSARVFGSARVCGLAQVFGSARVCGLAPLEYLCVTGLRFPVTILHTGSMAIGCQTKTFHEWLGVLATDEMSSADFESMRVVLTPLVRLFADKHGIVLSE